MTTTREGLGPVVTEEDDVGYLGHLRIEHDGKSYKLRLRV